MPKLSKDDEAALKEVFRLQGLSGKSADKMLRVIQAGSEAESASAAKEMRQDLLERLREQKKQGIKFGRADILEFLGQDDDQLPPEFQELLDDDVA
jgi:hypothetical protein